MPTSFRRAVLAGFLGSGLGWGLGDVALAQSVGGTVPESALQGPSFALPRSGGARSGGVGPELRQPDPSILQDSTLAPTQLAPSAPIPPPVSAAGLPKRDEAAGLDDLAAAYIRGLQEALPQHGYPTGPASGQMDDRTGAAILAYQRDAGLPQNILSVTALHDTINSVNFAKPPIYAGTAGIGAPPAATRASVEREAVSDGPAPDQLRWVQGRLKANGFDIDVDGQWGTRTMNAIKAYQASAGLPRTGQIDPALIQQLSR